MWAVYAKEENEPLSEGGVCRVACLALMEDGDVYKRQAETLNVTESIMTPLIMRMIDSIWKKP